MYCNFLIEKVLLVEAAVINVSPPAFSTPHTRSDPQLSQIHVYKTIEFTL
jgi:hypothetical protein